MALYAATWQFGLIAGPATSGFLYDVDPAVPYAVTAGCFGVAGLIVPHPHHSPAAAPHTGR